MVLKLFSLVQVKKSKSCQFPMVLKDATVILNEDYFAPNYFLMQNKLMFKVMQSNPPLWYTLHHFLKISKKQNIVNKSVLFAYNCFLNKYEYIQTIFKSQFTNPCFLHDYF